MRIGNADFDPDEHFPNLTNKPCFLQFEKDLYLRRYVFRTVIYGT
jgi:hypothetical protein